MHSSSEKVAHICKSCSNEFYGNYCNLCGEKVPHANDRSFKTFLHSIGTAITFADSKFLKTLWLVLRRPGFVSREISEGKTVNYQKPLSLFFVLNLIYFFFPVIQLFNASLNTQLLSPLGHFYQLIIAKKIVTLKMDVPSFSLVYNLKTAGFAKLMVMVFVVVASLPLNILFRKRNKYFTDHVGFMVELACFNLFVNAILLSVVAAFSGLGNHLDELVLTAFFISTNLYFLIQSNREFYKEKGWRLIVKPIVMIFFLKVALEVYRSILFFVTISSL
jgi:hypothetical protein